MATRTNSRAPEAQQSRLGSKRPSNPGTDLPCKRHCSGHFQPIRASVDPPGILGHRSIFAYEPLQVLGHGRYGTVFHARNNATGEDVAVKEIAIESMASLPSLPEIQYLSCCRGHPNVIELKEVAVDFRKDDKAYIVLERAENDLKTMLRKLHLFNEDSTRWIMRQVLQGIAHMHKNHVIHRDIKTANILINSNGTVKVCDMGLAIGIGHRSPTSPLIRKPGRHPFGTRCYCAPELLDEDTTEYTSVVDVWAAGCVMAELLCGDTLFKGRNVDQVQDHIFELIHMRFLDPKQRWKAVDKLRERIPPSVLSADGYDLLRNLLAESPEKRITAADALWHPWFSDYRQSLT